MNLRWLAFALLPCAIFALSANTTLAHDQLLFEFAPDPWNSERLTTAGAGTPQQLFYTADSAELSGFDLWLDNNSSPGTISFSILTEAGAILDETDITINTMTPQPGGHKIHVDLPSSAPLNKNKVYRIRINTAPSGLGIYYTDRLAVLEHNLPYTSEYSLGAAKLGDEIQPYTFKFALHGVLTEIAQADPEPELVEEETVEQPITIAITNARIANLTHNSATVTWTTNVAADSRVVLRTQLNPLYSIQTVTDPTLELEHTLTLTGLTPGINYFADTFSSLGQSITLTTYTIAFQTLPAPADQPAPPSEDPTTTPTEEETQPQTEEPIAGQPSEPIDSDNPPESGGQSDTTDNETNPNEESEQQTPKPIGAQPPLTVTPETDTGNTTISWVAPASGEPDGGYRVDIFDINYKLIHQIFVPSGTHSYNFPGLESGTYHAIVYTNKNGIYEKLATVETFTLQPESHDLEIRGIIAGSIILLTLIGYLWWKFKKKSAIVVSKMETT